jgi:CRISPR-associated protein Cas1
MIKRIVEISQGRCYLSVKNRQLVIRREDETESQIPLEDMGVLLIDNRATTYSHTALTELLGNNCAVVLSDNTHHPVGMLLPLAGNTTQTESFRHQAKVVKQSEITHKALRAMAEKVRSGDPENLEAQASRKYWPVFLQDTLFRRDMNGMPPNNLLNYGYMVLRAAVARSLVCAGLLPTLGIHHRNRYNAYCLADDVIEPFRGFVDEKVRAICRVKEDIANLDQQTKAELIGILYQTVTIAGQSGPLMVGLHRTTASLERCYRGEQKKLELPEVD